MAVNIGYKQFPEFDVRKDPENVYARFVKYAKRFKDNHLKAYNITDKAQQRSLFLDSIGESTLDIFEQLGDTGTDLDGAINALLNKFKESQNRLFNIHKIRCIKQGKDETKDSFIFDCVAVCSGLLLSMPRFHLERVWRYSSVPNSK